RTVWCSGDLFTGYRTHGALHLRDIFRNVVAELLPEPLVKVVKLPATLRMAVTEQPGRLNVLLLAYAPEKRADTAVVEDPMAVLNGEFMLLTAGRKIVGVTMAPDRTPVEYATEGNYTRIKLPPFEGCAVVTLDCEG
ncbi:MAG: hypothetical protein IJJ28_07935, partial [Lentisphaeria bacterium]|nr:hypothetical protein [Lentisphaeria bacterium]